MSDWPVHAKIDGPIVMIGFGSIGRGTLPLIARHFDFDGERMVVIDPVADHRKLLDTQGIRFVQSEVTPKTTATCSPRSSPTAAARASA